jgi:hypothetical protein
MMNIFINATLLAHVCAMLATTSGMHSTQSSSYTSSMFARAVSKQSTSPLYVLITVRNGNTGAVEETATPAPLLLWALSVEKHLSYDPKSLPELRRIANSEPSRTFVFTSNTVIDRIRRLYTTQQLAEARRFIERVSSDDLRQQIRAGESTVHAFYNHREGQLFQSYEDALAHALLERGILVGANDRTSLLYAP